LIIIDFFYNYCFFMKTLKIKDKVFVKYINHKEIISAIDKLAYQLNRDYKGVTPVFIGILNGAFMFTADLLKKFNEECELTFMALSSYAGTKSTGEVEVIIGLRKNIKNRSVIILEDIVDSGTTISYLFSELYKYEPKDVKVVTLLLKPDALKTDVRPDYTGIEIPNDFIVGYGLDYEGFGRNHKDIYKIHEY